MNEQALALSLADELDAVPETGCDPQLTEDAAAELRRQHAEIERERASRQAAQIENEALKSERARSGLELQRAVLAERERCARLCDAIAARCDEGFSPGYTMALQHCAAAIRNSQRPEPSNGWPDTDAERSAEC